jgi:hypothetical protein
MSPVFPYKETDMSIVKLGTATPAPADARLNSDIRLIYPQYSW